MVDNDSTNRQLSLPLGHLTQPEVDGFLSLIADMIGHGAWRWAEDTLAGIRLFIDTHARITDGQKKAIRRIGEARGGSWVDELDGGRGLV